MTPTHQIKALKSILLTRPGLERDQVMAIEEAIRRIETHDPFWDLMARVDRS